MLAGSCPQVYRNALPGPTESLIIPCRSRDGQHGTHEEKLEIK